MITALLGRPERVHTFLVPIINPPFVDNGRRLLFFLYGNKRGSGNRMIMKRLRKKPPAKTFPHLELNFVPLQKRSQPTDCAVVLFHGRIYWLSYQKSINFIGLFFRIDVFEALFIQNLSNGIGIS